MSARMRLPLKSGISLILRWMSRRTDSGATSATKRTGVGSGMRLMPLRDVPVVCFWAAPRCGMRATGLKSEGVQHPNLLHRRLGRLFCAYPCRQARHWQATYPENRKQKPVAANQDQTIDTQNDLLFKIGSASQHGNRVI